VSFRVAIAGATGVVGQEFLRLLEERAFPISDLRLMASARSAGRTMAFGGNDIVVEDLEQADFRGVDVAFFSAGSERADEARRAAREGALVIDNSSAFRMDPDVPLVVPQVNPDAALSHKGIIANPNCSTILMVMVLAPLERARRIRRIVVSTYQAVSGSGAAGLTELKQQAEAERLGEPLQATIYPQAIFGNAIPFVQSFDEGGLTTEEWKMVRETRRILGRPELAISCTCVRIPVHRAHSEAVNIEFESELDVDEARALLAAAPGIRVVDAPDQLAADPHAAYPTPRDAEGQDDVLVGRIRRDPSHPCALDLWLTGDQIRKGAALNAVEIAECVLDVMPVRS
jgi:aspartate-semialdehyde dehydrogenase